VSVKPTPREPTYDALALGLGAALNRVAPTMGRVAARVMALRPWVPFGFARCDDFARERWDRCGRWLRDMAALGKALDSPPQLADAILGRDGGRPIGKFAAVAIVRVADDDSIGAWVDLARCIPIRRFTREVRRAREAGSTAPLPSNRSFSTDGELWRSRDHLGLAHVRFGAPRPVKSAWDASFELHRALCGAGVGVTQFAEALVGQAYAGPIHRERTFSSCRRPGIGTRSKRCSF
jgi:hypothetical protein